MTLDVELLEGTFTYIGASESMALFSAPDVVVLLAVLDAEVKLGFM